MLCGTAIDTHGLAFEPQFSGVAGGTGNIQKLFFAAGILMAGEAYRQVSRVAWRGFLRRIHQETESRQVLGRGEALLRKRQFKGVEPGVAQALDLGTLGREIERLTVVGAPLRQVMNLLGGRIGR
ncbi:hypothetical protein D3C76_1428340 [compost metagenome]